MSAAELRDHVRARLNSLYTPREIKFTAALPLTDLAKVDKKALRRAWPGSGSGP